MRTVALFLLIAALCVFAAPQESAKPKSEPAPAPRFEAIPPSVAAGQTAQLTWAVEGATSVTIQPVVGSVPASGSAPVSPSETTTYTLTAVAPSGNISVTATVTVGPAATTPQTGAAETRTPESAAPAAETAPKLPVPHPAAVTDPASLAAPSDATTKPPVAVVDEHAFILGAEDQIQITVYGSPEFSGSHMIRPDGKITLNFIGEVMAADVTPEQLGNVIRDRIKKYVVDPDVSVSVLAVRSKKYFIQGEVNKTGEFPLTVPTRVLEALVNAGGFRDFANKKNIIIMRGTDMRGTERLKFNYNEVIKGKHLEQNIYLRPGDIILVH
jgi:polysaccharide export outer membrane protein